MRSSCERKSSQSMTSSRFQPETLVAFTRARRLATCAARAATAAGA